MGSRIKRFIVDLFRKVEYCSEMQKKEIFLRSFKHLGNNFFYQDPVTLTSAFNISIGDNVSIASFVHMWGEGEIEIGDDVMIASHCAITSVTHNPKNLIFNKENINKKVTIGNNVWIGSHSIIVPGVTIGNNVIIGAGSFVNKDIPDNTMFCGIPAVKKKDLDQFI